MLDATASQPRRRALSRREIVERAHIARSQVAFSLIRALRRQVGAMF